MMSSLAKLVVVALALILATNIIPGISVSGFGYALFVALVLGLINLTVRPVLGILTLPITILTFGLFSLVLNTLLFWGVALLVPHFEVSGFLAAFLGSLLVSTAYYLADSLLS